MLREDDRADRDFSEAKPRKDDRARHDDHKPEGWCVNERMAKGLTGRTVVVREEYDLAPYEGGRGPSEEAM